MAVPLSHPREYRTALADRIRPTVPPPVAECAEQHVYVYSQSHTRAKWSAELTPYMVDPMNASYGRRYRSVVLVAPAQSGKTQGLVDCRLAFAMIYEHGNVVLIEKTQGNAKDFSEQRLSPMIRDSERIRGMKTARAYDDGVFRKIMAGGQIIQVGWPSKNQLSGKSVPLMILTDLDRMKQDLGFGNVYEHARLRTRKYLSRGMTIAESSPGFALTSEEWSPQTPHEAPHVEGIFSLYNAGDRRRYYWACLKCGEYWMPPAGPECFVYKTRTRGKGKSPIVDGGVFVECPACGHLHGEQDKRALTALDNFLWVPEQARIVDGKVVEHPVHGEIWSGWLPGCAAAYQSWRRMVNKYLAAYHQYQASRMESTLKAVVMQDFAAPYVSSIFGDSLSVSSLQDRKEDFPRRVVPAGVRVIIASVDVQDRRFVCQIHGFGEGMECWILDRFDIGLSESRTYISGTEQERAPVSPAGHLEDWWLLVPRVIGRTYVLSDFSGRRMRVFACIIDSGGMPGVTQRAYEFWRQAKAAGWSHRVLLSKGVAREQRELVRVTYPDTTQRSSRHAGGAGDVPVWLIDTKQAKDMLMANLQRDIPGRGYVHFPEWLGTWFFKELAAERRDPKKWVQVGPRNESHDLLHMALSAAIALGMHKIDWRHPPGWAADWATNTEAGDYGKVIEPIKPKNKRIAPLPQPRLESTSWGFRP